MKKQRRAATQRPPRRAARNTNVPTKLGSYLLFDGTCKEALEFYKSVFGGALTLTTVGESPMAQMFPPQLHARVVHARLSVAIGDISASDWLAQNETPIHGNMVCLYLDGGTREELKRVFEKLSAGGKATDPLQEQPFGYYGALNDKFGVRWMFHTDRKS
jgi:PhnB protein